MRNVFLAALMAATALVPAASAQDHGDHGGDRGGNRGGGQQRAEPARPASEQRAQPQARPQAQAPRDRGRPGMVGRDAPAQVQQRQAQVRQDAQQRQQIQDQRAGVNRGPGNRNPRAQQGQRGDWNRDGNRNGNDGLRNNGRGNDNRGNVGRGNDNRGNDGRGDDWNRNGGRNGNQAWNRGWRNNNQYNWQGYRNNNRQAYRLPRYYAPRGYGYGYRRYGVGSVLNQLLFSQSYWISDPYDYRLPPAYGPYRWVRYYNDALLVNIYNGQVVDVISGIFW